MKNQPTLKNLFDLMPWNRSYQASYAFVLQRRKLLRTERLS